MQNSKKRNVTLLILRIIVGGMFVFAGSMKLMDMPNTILMMSFLGISPFVVWLVVLGELFAGLGVLFGVYTRLAALGIVVIMAGAIYFTKGNWMTIVFFFLGYVLMRQGGGDFRIKAKSKIQKTENN